MAFPQETATITLDVKSINVPLNLHPPSSTPIRK